MFINWSSSRDTTVQTLTLQPTVQDGVIIYEDSPLVSYNDSFNESKELHT